MKILLLGEFSSLHKNLKEGLQELGHEALIASNGDNWKNIPRDINLGTNLNGILGKIGQEIKFLANLKKFSNYDVLQIINPFPFYHRLLPNKYIFSNLLKNNKKVFLLAAGDDAYFWKFGRKKLKYSGLNDYLKYDLKKDNHYMEKETSFTFNQWLAKNVNGVIPIMYEYETCYETVSTLRKPIAIPINTNNIEYQDNLVNNKIVIFHGLNRYGFKGTKYVEEAFNILSNKYPNDLELFIEGKIPLDKYLKLMKKTNIVIDQVNSYSPGLNALYALAMGKVVMGGNEPESLQSLGISNSPIVNIIPSVMDIVNKIENLIENKNIIPSIGYKSRQYVEKNHNHIKIANKYINEWSK
ncbi:hypothetical protein QPK14_08750 [Photorhabdus temperata subsp. temperata]